MELTFAIIVFVFLISIILAIKNSSSAKQMDPCQKKIYYHHSNFVAASDRQIEYIKILGGKPPARLSMSRASKMIDELIEENNRKRAQKAEDEYNYKARLKEERELKVIASEMRNPNFKPARKRSRRAKDIYQFQQMVNDVIADDVIDFDEIEALETWLLQHQILDDDFKDALALLSQAKSNDKVSAETANEIYVALLDCVRDLRSRPST